MCARVCVCVCVCVCVSVRTRACACLQLKCLPKQVTDADHENILTRPHQKTFLFPVANLEEDRVGRSVQNFFWTLKCWPWQTTQYPADVEKQCSTSISDYTFIVHKCRW